jgi:hypothetical protein
MLARATSPMTRPDEPGADGDELALVGALTSMLRDKRRTLMEGDLSAQAMLPLWQPLLDRLAPFTARRAQGGAGQPGAQLRAQAEALRQEYEGLQHTLQLWSEALRAARDKSARRGAEPVYGQAQAGRARGSLGRG